MPRVGHLGSFKDGLSSPIACLDEDSDSDSPSKNSAISVAYELPYSVIDRLVTSRKPTGEGEPSRENKINTLKEVDHENPSEEEIEANLKDSSDKSTSNSLGKKMKGESNQHYIMKIYDSPALVKNLLLFLRCGSVMLKHGRSGKPHRRLFWISSGKNAKELHWADHQSNFNGIPSSISLNSVSSIQLGFFSKVFQRHPIPTSDPAFFFSFSLELKGGVRTVDIVASNLPDYEAWVVGLAHLIEVDPFWGAKLNITSEKGFDQLSYFESNLCETHFIFPVDYLTLKAKLKLFIKHTIEVLDKCENNAKKAQKILKGIHPPALNSQGAIYMTKGELRFLCPKLSLDIFRISHIWMLFQQMNLVYDDNFVPVTAFGITKRS
ncbi:unnamed protein product [Phytomonas sp. Hart1]|nr:unnamed protein product [Phytomonas sp. Hart1]|eukprot:CCW68042.1 unnamed protein product [Phytomonas sp. isolate Hart1]